MSPDITSIASSPSASSPPSHDGKASPQTLRDIAPNLSANPTTLPSSLDPFTITTSTGFMPLRPPITTLPAPFKPLQTLLNAMPIVKQNGIPGLLATYQLGPTVDSGALPDLLDEVNKLVVAADGKPDLALVTAAFRDYAFLASAYLLEPCWERWSKGLEGYGLGREVLPKCIAGPLVATAKLLDIPPFMSYAAAYTLYNYRFVDPEIGVSEYGNLRLVRAFERGLDPKSSEAGFVLTHVDMVKHSPSLTKGATDLLNAIATHADRTAINKALDLLLNTMHAVEASMETMWRHSKPQDYLGYRTFIFGITNQSMFPHGVVYQGQSNDNDDNNGNGGDGNRMSFRGESGANDSMIPLLDALLEIPMPENPLTAILKDFRGYRPKPHRKFLEGVRVMAREVGVREFCCGGRGSEDGRGSGSESVGSTLRYLRLLDCVRSFRWRHWLFAREYIIRRSSHPTATGGSPIVTWLPNQLQAVMKLMCATWDSIPTAQRAEVSRDVVEMMANVKEQGEKLQKEVDRWCQERGE